MFQKKSKGWFKHFDFIVLDLLCLQIAFFISYVLTQQNNNPYSLPLYMHMAIFIELADFVVIFLVETYKNVLKRGYYIEFSSAIQQSLIMAMVCSLYLIVIQEGNDYSRAALFSMCGIYCVISYVARLILKKYLRERMKKGGHSNLVVITTNSLANRVIRSIKANNFELYTIKGLIVLDKDMTGQMVEGVPVVANKDTAADYLCQGWVDEVFMKTDDSTPYPKELIEKCNIMGITLHLHLAKITEDSIGKQNIGRIGEYVVLTNSINYMTTKQAFFKRLVDIIFGVCGCLATVIITIFIGPIIYLQSPGPIFFAQERIGQNGKPFKMYKFRSMYMDAEERKAELMKQNKMSNGLMFKLDFDPRIIGNEILPDGTKKTGIGQFIRSTSLDEFPQFYNVLKGQMSVVGFRPALPSEYEQYEYHHRARIAMKPGITGMWQVSGRSDITDFEEVVELDTEYIRNWTMGLDFRILFKTITAVLNKDGSV